MKKLIPLFSLILILASSCNTSFHTTRQHAHRHYVKTDLEHPEQEAMVEQTNNEVVLLTTQKEVTATKIIPTQKKVVSPNQHKTVVKNKKKEFFLKATFEKIKSLFSQKPHKLEKSVKKTKATQATVAFNIISMVLGIIAAVLGFIAMFTFLFTIAFPYTAGTAITMVGIVGAIGGVAIIFGVLGLSLGSPKRGMAIAGIITAGVGIFISLLAMILFFVFL
jgi:hypothetical protein